METNWVNWRHPLRLAPRREHVMGEVKFVVLPTVVWSKKCLNVTPRTVDGVSIIPRPSETGYRHPCYWIGTLGKCYSHHRNIPANLVDTMFSGRTASRAVYPGIPWWHYLSDAPYVCGFVTLYYTHLHLPECTLANWCLKDAFECGLMGKRRSNLDSGVGRNWEGKKCIT